MIADDDDDDEDDEDDGDDDDEDDDDDDDDDVEISCDAVLRGHIEALCPAVPRAP